MANLIFGGIFGQLAAHMKALDALLRAQVQEFEPEIRDMADYCIDTSGKRIRPALVFLSGRKASPKVAGYFKRRKLIGNQIIEKELADGSLIISAKVSHDNQILPIVRYWIPNLSIISPESLQAYLEQGLRAYADGKRS